MNFETESDRGVGNFRRTLPAAFALLTLIAFAIGLFFEGYRDIHYAPAALSLLLAGGIAVLPALRYGLSVPHAATALILFVLWLYITLSLAWSSVPFASLVTYLVFIALPLCFFAPLMAPGRAAMTGAACGLLLAGLAVLAGWAVIQMIFLRDTFGDRAHHPLADPNNLAALFSLGLLPSLARLLAAGEDRRRRLVYGALTVLFAAGIAATESRGAILACLPAMLLLTFLLRGTAKGAGKSLLIVAIAAAAIFLVVAAINDFRLFTRLADLAAPAGDQSAQARLAIWGGALRLFADHFRGGTGFGTFYLYYPSYRLPGADNSTGNWAHFDALQLGAETGIAGFLLFYALAAAVALRTFRALKSAPLQSSGRAAIAGFSCALLALFLHSHVNFNFYLLPILIVAGIWLAGWYEATAAANMEAGSFRDIELAGWQRPFLIIVALAVAGLIAVMALSSAWGQHHLLRANGLIRQGLTTQFVAAIETAERFAPRSFIDPEVHLAAFYIDLLGENSAALFSAEEQSTLFTQTLALLAAAEAMNPAWAEVDYKRGQLYAADPSTQAQALEALGQALKKNPAHMPARETLARAYIGRGQVEPAYELLSHGLKYPHAPEARTRFVTLMRQLEGPIAAKRAYEASKAASPESAGEAP